MTDKYLLYCIMFPFRSRRQRRLTAAGAAITADDFRGSIPESEIRDHVADASWRYLRQNAFVRDFRPRPTDSFYAVFGFDPADLIEDLFRPLVVEIGLFPDEITADHREFEKVDNVNELHDLLLRLRARDRKAAGEEGRAPRTPAPPNEVGPGLR